VIELEIADLDLDDAVRARLAQSARCESPLRDPALVALVVRVGVRALRGVRQ